MRKLIFLVSSCIACSNCFTQSPAQSDSAKPSVGNTFKANENIQNSLKPELSIFPNPAKNKITVQVKNFNPGMVAVKVIDIKGKLIREDIRLLTQGTEDVVMFLMLKAGIYIIMVSEQGKVARKKLVIF